ncbi:MAG: hypothetical protein HYY13_04980 [Nitrospirae bacterium]|nr:hypothetical protein [Nitrospirota bacterium]
MAEAFDSRRVRHLADAFRKHGVRYLIIDDVIRSKEAAGRVHDREVLPRLKAFRDWWLQRQKEGS